MIIDVGLFAGTTRHDTFFLSRGALMLISKQCSAVSQVVFYVAFKAIMSSMDPQSSKRKEAKSKSKKALGKLGLDLSTLDLSEHEEIIAGEVVHSDEVGWWFPAGSARRGSNY